MINLITTFFYVGRMRPAPGTWGSLAALVVGVCLIFLVNTLTFIILIAVVFLLGWWATHQSTKGQEDHDPSYIVIDEVAGQWIALVPLAVHGFDSIAALLAFAAFRFFDIVKPGPIGIIDRRGDAMGVMGDDVIAGVFAGGVVLVYLLVTHLIGATG